MTRLEAADEGPSQVEARERCELSVIVSTYNGSAQLNACLAFLTASIARTRRTVEILIADDGSSSEETTKVIEAHKRVVGVSLRRIRQDDLGFRLARSRNNALRFASGEVIVFLDHDIVVPSCFVEAVLADMRPGWFLGGRRVCLGDPESQRLLDCKPGRERRGLRLAAILAMLRRRPGARYLLPLRDRSPAREIVQDWRGMAGFCLCVYRSDLLAIDGFDNEFEGYGVEDWDLMARLSNSGVSPGYLGRRASVLHLWHEESPLPLTAPAYSDLEAVIESGRVSPRSGLSDLAGDLR